MRKGQWRRRELTTCKSDLRSRSKAKRRRAERRVDDDDDDGGGGEDSGAEGEDGCRYDFATPESPGRRPRDVPASLAATRTPSFDDALAALEASEIPRQESRTGQEKGAKFPTSKAHISVVFHSF